MKISLTQGKFTIVGPKDYKYLMQWKWYYHSSSGGYAVRTDNLKGQTIQMHRVILERMGYKNFAKSDHIDRDGTNNFRSNLCPATACQNGYNRGKQKNNSSGYTGVSWHKRDKKWIARIQVNGIQKFLGYYSIIKNAVKAYNKAACKYHSKFAVLNRI